MRLSEKEWAVLNVLWQSEKAELSEITNSLYAQTKWSKNTVLTYLTRMQSKGLVEIDKTVTPHLYFAVLDKESCQKKERQNFLKHVYIGATGDLIAAFLKEEPISQEEKEKLKKILDDMEV